MADGELLVATAVKCTVRAPAQTRDVLRAGLRGLAAKTAVDAVLLAASELVSNCVRHAGLHDDELIEVRVRRVGSDLRLEVADGGPGFDTPASSAAADAAHEPQTHGRGLRIIQTLAVDWGVGTTDGKNTVWVRLDSTGKGPHEPDPDRDL